MRRLSTWLGWEAESFVAQRGKDKGAFVDLRTPKALVTPISIQGISVDILEDYKYLGVYINNKLD